MNSNSYSAKTVISLHSPPPKEGDFFAALDEGVEHIAHLRSRLLYWSLTAQTFGDIKTEDREMLLLSALEEANSAHNCLSQLLQRHQH